MIWQKDAERVKINDKNERLCDKVQNIFTVGFVEVIPHLLLSH